MMGFVGWVLGYLWLICVLYLAGKATGWLIFRGGLRVIMDKLGQWIKATIFLYWELPLRVITGRPVHAKVLSKIEKLENDLGYRVELLADPARLGGSVDDVIWFQRAHGLVPDGRIGPKTMAVAKMIEHKRTLVSGMIGAQEYQWIEDEAVISPRTFAITSHPAGRPDLDRLRLIAYQTKIDVQYGRMRRNGS